jgi:hypothetical protein
MVYGSILLRAKFRKYTLYVLGLNFHAELKNKYMGILDYHSYLSHTTCSGIAKALLSCAAVVGDERGFVVRHLNFRCILGEYRLPILG